VIRNLLMAAAGVGGALEVEYIGSSQGTTGGSLRGTLTLPKPADAREGDTLVASFYLGSALSAIVGPAGWESHSVVSAQTQEWSYTVGASELPEYIWTFTGTTVRCGGTISCFRNAEIGPVGALSSATTPTVAASVTIPAGVTSAELLAFYARSSNTVTVTTPPPGMTLIQSYNASQPSFYLYRESLTAPGPTGNRSATFNSTMTGQLVSVVPKGTEKTPKLSARAVVESSTATFSINTPEHQPGNLMLVELTYSGSVAWPVQPGWTEIMRYDAGSPPCLVLARIATDNEPASYSFTSGGVTGTWKVMFGIFPKAQIGAVGTLVNSSSTGTTLPSLDITKDSALLLAFGSHANGGKVMSCAGMDKIFAADGGSAYIGNPSSALFGQKVNTGATGTRLVVSTGPGTMTSGLLSLYPV